MKEVEPRLATELNKQYTDLCSKAGDLQYKLQLNTKLLERLNRQIDDIASEADARAKLDRVAAETKKQDESQQSGAV